MFSVAHLVMPHDKLFLVVQSRSVGRLFLNR